jgi:dTDP-4-amino-4,6-dideoxygalactose transaminase
MTPLGVRAALARKGIQVRRPVDVLLHRSFALPAPSFPAAERVFASTVSLPLYPALTEADQDRVIDAFRRVVEQGTSR